jgi:hypothetical protein
MTNKIKAIGLTFVAVLTLIAMVWVLILYPSMIGVLIIVLGCWLLCLIINVIYKVIKNIVDKWYTDDLF